MCVNCWMAAKQNDPPTKAGSAVYVPGWIVAIIAIWIMTRPGSREALSELLGSLLMVVVGAFLGSARVLVRAIRMAWRLVSSAWFLSLALAASLWGSGYGPRGDRDYWSATAFCFGFFLVVRLALHALDATKTGITAFPERSLQSASAESVPQNALTNAHETLCDQDGNAVVTNASGRRLN